MNSKDALETIRKIVGEDSYMEILQQVAGSTVYFPESFEWQNKSVRDVQLREDYYSGEYEISDLALKYDLSISRVYKIVQRRE